METKEYIKLLKDKTKREEAVAFRQAMCWYLYSEQVPVSIIANVLHCKRRQVYRRMYSCRDLLETKDKLMLQVLEETKNHKMVVKPLNIEANICTFHRGYNLIIDNVIY